MDRCERGGARNIGAKLVAAGIGYRYGDIVVELTAMSRHCI